MIRKLLLAHGTTKVSSERIENYGFFNEGTHFLNMYPDPKIALFGTAGFGLRNHPLTWRSIEDYCKQDLVAKPFKNQLTKAAKDYIAKRHDSSPGLIYVVEAPENILTCKGGMRTFFIPGEVRNTEIISTSNIKYIVTAEDLVDEFEDLGHDIKLLEDVRPDGLGKRMYFTAYSRFRRIFGRKL